MAIQSTQVYHNGELLSDIIAGLNEQIQNLYATRHTALTGLASKQGQTASLTLSNGTFSGVLPYVLVDDSTYLVSITYTKNNALVDRSLYCVKVVDSVIQSTTCLVGCVNGNDSPLVTKQNNNVTFATDYTKTDGSSPATACTVKFL